MVDPMDTTVGNRFAPYGPENHSAPLWITSILGLIYAFGVLLIRVFIKRRVFGWDDSLIVAATVSLIELPYPQAWFLLTCAVDWTCTSSCVLPGSQEWLGPDI